MYTLCLYLYNNLFIEVMLFNDPLAILQYLGGPIPNHLSMIFYAYYIYTDAYQNMMTCQQQYPDVNIPEFYDVKWMIAAHMVHIVLHFIKKSLSKKDDF